MKERIKGTDNILDVVQKMSEGNPGAVTVLSRMIKDGAAIDPQDFMGGLGAVLSLDTCRIYGSRIWMLYKDVCGEDLMKTLAVLRACQLGELTDIEMQHAIDFRGEGIDVDGLVATVKGRLEQFGVAV